VPYDMINFGETSMAAKKNVYCVVAGWNTL
jgi:hypothetical protein